MEIGDFDLKQRKISKSLVNREARRYVEANPRLKGVMGLFRAVFSLQRRLSRAIPDQLPHIKGAEVAHRIAEGRLLVEAGELEVDLSTLREMMRELGKALQAKGESRLEDMDRFIGEELGDDGRLRGLVDAFLAPEEEEL